LLPKIFNFGEKLARQGLHWLASWVSVSALDWFARLWALSAFITMFFLPVVSFLVDLVMPTNQSYDLEARSKIREVYGWFGVAFVQLPAFLAYFIARKQEKDASRLSWEMQRQAEQIGKRLAEERRKGELYSELDTKFTASAKSSDEHEER
jgi:hypothetical protein